MHVLAAALLWSKILALSADIADKQCAVDGQCAALATTSRTKGSAFVQLKTTLGASIDAKLGERKMLKLFQGHVVINSSEVLLQTGASRPASESEKQAFLSSHNVVRCMHGSPDVVWSDAVANSANSYASSLKNLVHSNSYDILPPAGPAGENLYWSSSPSTPSDVLASWYNEVKACQGGPTGFTDGCYTGRDGQQTGHFTALIWKGVKEIGCAWSDDSKIALCRYKADDVLNSNTPNMLPQSNYVQQVPRRIKTLAECQGGGSSPPSTPAPTPQPVPTSSPPAPTASPPTPAPPSCVDSTTWSDPWYRLPCTGWAGYACSGYPFSARLQRNCPVSCRQCTASGPAPTPTPTPPTPSPPTPAPPTASPTPAPVEGSGSGCVSGTGTGGCIMQSYGCQGPVSFSLQCTSPGGLDFQFQLSMPDNYSWNLIEHCSQCFDVQVI